MKAWGRLGLAIWAVITVLGAAPGWSAAPPRLVIVMVWDGLRPDMVSAASTPNLYKFSHAGVYFASHHCVYPTQTMVNAAALSTATPPAATAIWGDVVYLAPFLPAAPSPDMQVRHAQSAPIDLESSPLLAALNGPGGLDGHLLGASGVGAELGRTGGFVAIVGKRGPTFLFDDGIASGAPAPFTDALLLSDDMVIPPAIISGLKLNQIAGARTMGQWQMPPFLGRDTYFGQSVEKLLPTAKQALAKNRSVLLILWLHNPDITEHLTGLGSKATLTVLANCDAILGHLLADIDRLALRPYTDLIVLSDHGFATIKASVRLADLLVGQGLKQSGTSNDVVVMRNGGSDEIFISRKLSPTQRRDRMRKIVAYAAAQPWCGPIFGPPKARVRADDYRGALAGTFSQARFHLWSRRAPDLVISFLESPQTNQGLAGPDAQALELGAGGERRIHNHSMPPIRTLPGAVYADTPFTTGMGMHGALGKYEVHNFAAADGPDFRRSYIDTAPTSNLDLGVTLRRLLGLPAAPRPGRLLSEALTTGGAAPAPRLLKVRTVLAVSGQRVVTTVDMARVAGEDYPQGAQVEHLGTVHTAR